MTECKVYWGSHGCGLEPGHVGDHVCDPDDCASTVSNSGYDAGGFRWDLYGSDAPEEWAMELTWIHEAGNMLPGGRVPNP